MTDNEIIKALECCGKPYNICVECPMPNNIKDDCRCGEHLANYALDIINRQQAEIEKIKKKLKHYLNTNEENGVVYIPKFVIDNFLKEMVGNIE